MLGSLTSGFLWSRWRGKRSRHSRRMRNPQFYVSGKRPMLLIRALLYFLYLTLQLKSNQRSTIWRDTNYSKWTGLCKFSSFLGVSCYATHTSSALQMCEYLHITPCIGLLLDTWNWGLRMRRECRERFPHHRGLAIPTCTTARIRRTCRDACWDR